jgi:hypothetical protein
MLVFEGATTQQLRPSNQTRVRRQEITKASAIATAAAAHGVVSIEALRCSSQ